MEPPTAASSQSTDLSLLQQFAIVMAGMLGAGVTVVAAVAFTIFVVWLITLL